MSNTIQVGDIVTVYFDYCETIYNAEVIYVPQATGDSFKLLGRDKISCNEGKCYNGKCYNVQNYNYMVKIEERK